MASEWLEEFRKKNGYRHSSSQNEDNGKSYPDSSKQDSSTESSWLEQFRKENGYIGRESKSPTYDRVDEFNRGVDAFNQTMGLWGQWYDHAAGGLDSVGWADAGREAANKNESASIWMNRIGELRAWANANKDLLGDDYEAVMKSIQDTTNATYWMNKGYEKTAEYFGQWDSQEAYDQAFAPTEQEVTMGKDVGQMEADLSALQQAYDDLDEIMVYREAGYGTVPEAERDEKRAWHDQRYQEILDTYGVDGNVSKWDLMSRISELEDEVGETKESQERISATNAEANRLAGYYMKYDGMDYGQLKQAMETVTDPQEKAWLQSYAGTKMTAADYETELASTKEQADAMQNYIDVLNARYAELDTAIANYSTSGDPEDAARLTTAQQELDTLLRQLTEAEDDYDALMTRAWELEHDGKYVAIRENADFDEKSGYVTSFVDASGNVVDTTKDSRYRYINSKSNPNAFLQPGTDNYSMDSQWLGSGGHVYGYMNQDEVKTYNYIVRTQGWAAANDYLEEIRPALDERMTAGIVSDISDITREAPVFANALSVGMNLTAGQGILDIAAQNAGRKLSGSYEPVNYYGNAMTAAHASKAIRGTTAAMITDATGTIQLDEDKHPILAPILNGRGLADVYQLGMSAVDSRVAGLFGSPVLASILQSSSAATQGVLDALERGATDEQALTMGMWNGAFEAVFEYFEVDNLLKGNPSMIKNVVNQALTEGFGEGATTLANDIADAIIMADKSAIAQAQQEYIAQGMDPEQARKKALVDAGVDLLWDTIGGAVSGGFAAGGQSMLQNYSADMASGRYVQENQMQDPLMQLARSMAGAGAAGKLDAYAQRASERQTTRNIGRLYNEVNRVVDRQNMDQLAQALEARGLSKKDATHLATAIGLDINGIELTKSQEKLLKQYESSEKVMAAVEDVLGSTAFLKRNAGVRGLGATQKKAATAAQEAPGQAKAEERTTVPEAKIETTHKVSEDGETHLIAEPEKTVSIRGIESIEDGKMKLQLQDGSVVDAGEVSFGSADEAMVYSTLADMGVNVNAANVLASAFKTADISGEAYTLGIREAYLYGMNNDLAALAKGEYASALTEHQRDVAFKMGKIFGGQQTAKAESTVRKARQEAEKKGPKEKSTGKVHFERKGRTFDAVRETALKTMEQLSATLGVEFYVYESYVNENGRRVYMDENGKEVKAPNGWYDPATGAIHIDLNAGMDGKGTMLFTIAHELTHFIRQWSPAKFRVLANFLVSQYNRKDQSLEDLIRAQIAKAKRNGRTIDRDTAFEEVVADSMEAMLTDGNVVQMMADLKQQDKTLWQKIVDWFKDLAEDLRKLVDAYTDIKPDSVEGRMVADMQDVIIVLESLYADALVEASENYQAAGGQKNTTQEGGSVLEQARENKKYRASNNSPLSRRSVMQRSSNSTHQNMPSAAAAGLLGISNIADAAENVKHAISVLGSFYQSVDSKRPVMSFKHVIDGSNLEGSLVAAGVLKREGQGSSAYRKDGEHELRMSNHSAHAENFKGAGEHLSIALYKTAKVNKFLASDQNVIEAVFKKDFLDRNPSVLKALIRDIARFIATGEYHDTAGAMKYNYSGSAKFVAGAKARMEADAKARDDIKRSDLEYLAAVERGDMATAQRMVDEAAKAAGYSLKVYHGTNARFTEFQKGDLGYHVGSEEQAERRESSNVLSLYASIHRPLSAAFDFGDWHGKYVAEMLVETEQFEDYPEMDSTNKRLLEISRMEKEAEADLALRGFLQELGYDGVVYENAFEGAGESYIAFEAEQLKSAAPVTYDDSGNVIPLSERFDTTKADIRYSDRDAGAERVTKALQKENAKLKEDVKYLKDLLKIQKTVTNGTVFTRSSVEAAAGILMKSANAKGDKAELTKLLNGFYEYIAKGEELTWESVMEMAKPVSDWLMEHQVEKKELDGFAQEVLQDIRGSRFYLDDQQKQNAAYSYGSYNEYRKKMMGTAVVTDKANMSLDSWWHDMSGRYPSVFDPNIASSDMPEAFADAVSRLRSMEIDVYGRGYDREMMARDLMYQVYDSYWNVSTLKTVADVKQRQIDELKSRHAERIEKIRNDHRDARERIKAEFRKELKAVKDDMRKAEREHIQKAVDRQRQIADRKRDNAQKAEMRRKIRKTIRDLEKLLSRGDKHKNVKEGMKDLAATAIASAEVLFMESYTENDMIRDGVTVDLSERESRLLDQAMDILTVLDNPPADPEGIEAWYEQEAVLKEKLYRIKAQLKEVFERQRKKMDGTLVTQIMADLAKAYASLENSPYEYIRGAYRHEVWALLHNLSMEEYLLGGVKAKDMTHEQMQRVYDAYSAVLTSVRDANKIFAENIKETKQELANKVMIEESLAARNKPKTALGRTLSKFMWNNLKPVYAFERIGSSTLSRLYGNIRKGQDTWAIDMREANEFRKGIQEKYGYDSWDMDKVYTFKTNSGADFKLTLEQMMSIYAYSKRAHAYDHMMKGGFVFDDNTTTKVNVLGVPVELLNEDATAYKVSLDTLSQIVGALTQEQAKFVDEMQEYLSSTMSDKGNSVSMKLYGIRLFNEKYYFPLKSAGQYMAKAREADLQQEQGQINLVNAGFAKSLAPKASNPIVLSGFMDVWSGHVNEMSMYHSFVLPMEDFRRVYNYSTPNEAKSDTDSVNAAIQNAHGKGATAYIDQLYQDLNGGALSDSREGIAKSMVGKFKKAATMASLSVVFQQPSSIGRAFALVDLKHFDTLAITRGVGRAVFNRKKHDALWDELKKYAPVAMIKEMGYFDTGMGRSATEYLQAKEYSGIKEKTRAFFKDSGYRDEALSKPAAVADELTWVEIWKAVKNETAERNPKMDRNSEEFLKIAGDRFSEVIDKTQVYDSVLARSANMRSKSLFMNMATSFMAEPTTTMNMVWEALMKAQKGQKKAAARVMGSVAVAIIINAALSSLVYAARDDDEDETYLEKYFARFFADIVDGFNPITYIPFLKDVWSIAQGFDVERADMSLVSDLVDALQDLMRFIDDDTDSMSDEERKERNRQIAGAWMGAAEVVANLLGIPMKNVRREIKGAVNMFGTVREDLGGRKTTWGSFADVVGDDLRSSVPILGWLPGETKAERLYDAVVAGDEAYMERLKASYADEEKANAAIRKVIKEKYMAGELSKLDARQMLISFDDMDVVKAHWTLDEWDYDKENASEDSDDYGKYDRFFAAVESGRDLKSVISEYTSNGVSDETLRRQITDHFKPIYVDMSASDRAGIKGYILNAMEACGQDRGKAELNLMKWDFEAKYGYTWDDRGDAYRNGAITKTQLVKEMMIIAGKTQEQAELEVEVYDWQRDIPNCDITTTGVRDYHENCEGVGISRKTFYTAWRYYMDTSGEVDEETGESILYSKAQKVLPYIDGLDLTPEQKTALALCWWGASAVRKYKLW